MEVKYEFTLTKNGASNFAEVSRLINLPMPPCLGMALSLHKDMDYMDVDFIFWRQDEESIVTCTPKDEIEINHENWLSDLTWFRENGFLVKEYGKDKQNA